MPKLTSRFVFSYLLVFPMVHDSLSVSLLIIVERTPHVIFLFLLPLPFPLTEQPVFGTTAATRVPSVLSCSSCCTCTWARRPPRVRPSSTNSGSSPRSRCPNTLGFPLLEWTSSWFGRDMPSLLAIIDLHFARVNGKLLTDLGVFGSCSTE